MTLLWNFIVFVYKSSRLIVCGSDKKSVTLPHDDENIKQSPDIRFGLRTEMLK